jgi:cytidylate kinase
LDEKRLVEEVKTVIRKLYDEDNVVIVGRGGNYALKDGKDIIHLLLVASMEHRIKFLTDKYRMSKKQAERAINRADAIRYAFLDYFSEGGNHDDPLLYTMVLNMDQVSMEKAEDLVVGLIL